ncbi:18a5dcec-7090-4143-8472-19bb5d0baf64 [Sclerotinia trifoliorum]|uniref:18a5dcec-7090-4143-8472-19bb5d0baf64 n=1 Tax=Sclerotinia trifoliorum TaxID=28548 RepID=A0A8H2VPA4_9HELO|nr:18a5dcec-7090-4143-8472-19bb5d0baf64 [Sclerotinia trifoliorum]
MNIPRKHNPYLDPTNKQHRDYTRLDVSHSPDNVPDTPFNSPTAMSLSHTEWSSPNLNPISLNQIIMDGNKSSPSSSLPRQPHQSHTHQPTSAHSDWRPISRDRVGSSGSERSEITSDSRKCRCRDGGVEKRDSGNGPNSRPKSYNDSHCEQCILRDDGVERGRCRTRTNSSSSRDKTSGSREKRRRLDL